MDDFMAALATLETDLSPFARRGHPLILLGDFNVDLALDAGERCVALKAFLRALGLTFFSADRCPTWRHRRLDYVVCNRLVVDRCCGIGDPLVCPWAVVTVCTEAQRALGVDHGLLLHELLLSHVHGVPVGRVGRAARRAAFLDRPCKMRVCNPFLLQQQVYAYLDAASSNDGPDPHCFLSHCAATCCAPALVFRYQDSPGLRALCRARSLSSDPAERRRLSFEIHVCRKAEKKRWKLSVLAAASAGDWRARRFLQRKAHQTSLVAQGLANRFGSREAAVSHVKAHFDERFGRQHGPPLSFQLLPDTEPDFTCAEVASAVGTLKAGKTTGMSKVSAELLKHLVGLPFGLYLLTELLNAFLRDPGTANLHLADGWVILLPKKAWVTDAADFRPIVCGEVFTKLAAKLATARVVSSWPLPSSCFGCVGGKGVSEAIYLVKHAVQESAGLAEPPVLVQLDVSRAFDSLHINSILQYMIDHWASASAKSATLLR